MLLRLEKRALQTCVAVAALVPVLAGGWGVFEHHGGGAGGFPSHYRYLSGLLLAIGIGFWTTVGGIECKTGRFRLLAALVVAGGLARLAGLTLGDTQSWSVGGALTMELLVVPLLCLWQARVGAGAPPDASLGRRPSRTPRQKILPPLGFARPARRSPSGIRVRLKDAFAAAMAVVLVPRPTHPRATYRVLDDRTNADLVNVAGRRICKGGGANQNGEHSSLTRPVQ